MNDDTLQFPIEDLRFRETESLSDSDALRKLMQIRADIRGKIKSGELEATPQRLALLEEGDRVYEKLKQYL